MFHQNKKFPAKIVPDDLLVVGVNVVGGATVVVSGKIAVWSESTANFSWIWIFEFYEFVTIDGVLDGDSVNCFESTVSLMVAAVEHVMMHGASLFCFE